MSCWNICILFCHFYATVVTNVENVTNFPEIYGWLCLIRKFSFQIFFTWAQTTISDDCWIYVAISNTYAPRPSRISIDTFAENILFFMLPQIYQSILIKHCQDYNSTFLCPQWNYCVIKGIFMAILAFYV